jgi:hypothetical protein
VLGKRSPELTDVFAAMTEAQDFTLNEPGASCRDIAAAPDEHMRSY